MYPQLLTHPRYNARTMFRPFEGFEQMPPSRKIEALIRSIAISILVGLFVMFVKPNYAFPVAVAYGCMSFVAQSLSYQADRVVVSMEIPVTQECIRLTLTIGL